MALFPRCNNPVPVIGRHGVTLVGCHSCIQCRVAAQEHGSNFRFCLSRLFGRFGGSSIAFIYALLSFVDRLHKYRKHVLTKQPCQQRESDDLKHQQFAINTEGLDGAGCFFGLGSLTRKLGKYWMYHVYSLLLCSVCF